MIPGLALAGIFTKAIANLPSRASEEGNIRPADMSDAVRFAVSEVGGGTLAFQTALNYLADAMAAHGVADAHCFLNDDSSDVSLSEAHAYLTQALRIVRAL